MATVDTFYQSVLENMFDGVCAVDNDRKIICWNRAAEMITGYTAAEMIGVVCCTNLPKHVNDRGERICGGNCHFVKVMRTGATFEEEMFVRNRSGRLISVQVRIAPVKKEDGVICGATEIFRSRTVMREDDNKMRTLAKMAYLDSLTELGNSQYMDGKLQGKLEEIKKHRGSFGVILVSVKNFKEINEKYGHDVGDRALRIIARTLAKNVESPDVVGRWYGMNFLIFLMNYKRSVLALQADKIRTAIGETGFYIDGEMLKFTSGIAATMAKPEDTPQSLLQRLEKYLYANKPINSVLSEEEDE